MLTDVTNSLRQLLLLLLSLCLTDCVPIDDQPLSAVGQRLLQDIERTAAVTPTVSTVSASGIPQITGEFILEFSLNDFRWTHWIQWIQRKSKSGVVTRVTFSFTPRFRTPHWGEWIQVFITSMLGGEVNEFNFLISMCHFLNSFTPTSVLWYISCNVADEPSAPVRKK